MKVQKMLRKPVHHWTEIYGMRRAIKVLNLQAQHLRNAGDHRAAYALRVVSDALRGAIAKPKGVAEMDALGWVVDEQVKP